ncbi:MAG: hypothetical protein GWP04_06275 [Gammaproteobacteria bacterium]|nr:hypothetical protein [Gammaproteobacteria bacterium]
MDTKYYRDLIRPLVEGRKFILAGAVLAGYPTLVKQLRSLGAARPFIVASGRGTGEVPSGEDAEWAILDLTASDVIENIRVTATALADLPPDVEVAIDAWDPEGSAVMLGQPFYMGAHISGRPVWGRRRPEWEALEDKVRADAVWDAAGIPRAPSEVVAAAGDELRSGYHSLDRGLGTAWAGDAKEGFNGGAVYLRWVRNDADADEARAFFGEHCDRVRVMPFLEGIPCSIHGMVFPDVVIAFRPCEMIVLRPGVGNKLHYGGAATFWDPPDADREMMRDAARAVGDVLREWVDYRGAFTIDGVMTDDGFRPTELNTRAGVAIGGMLAGIRDLPLGMIQRALIEGEPLDYRPRELERLIVDSADRHRGGGALATVDRLQAETDTRHLVADGDGYREAREGEEADATLQFGPGGLGGFVLFRPRPERTPVGPSLAPRAVGALRLADEIWNLGIGPLAAARSVR